MSTIGYCILCFSKKKINDINNGINNNGKNICKKCIYITLAKYILEIHEIKKPKLNISIIPILLLSTNKITHSMMILYSLKMKLIYESNNDYKIISKLTNDLFKKRLLGSMINLNPDLSKHVKYVRLISIYLSNKIYHFLTKPTADFPEGYIDKETNIINIEALNTIYSIYNSLYKLYNNVLII